MLDTLKRTKAQVEGGHVSEVTQNALIPVVDGCRLQVELLDSTIVKILPAPGESSWKRGMKAFLSVSQEKKILEITTTLRNYVQTLTYHEVTGVTRQSPETIKSSFMVPFERDSKFVDRPNIIAQIGQKLKTQSRVALTGIGGVG